MNCLTSNGGISGIPAVLNLEHAFARSGVVGEAEPPLLNAAVPFGGRYLANVVIDTLGKLMEGLILVPARQCLSNVWGDRHANTAGTGVERQQNLACERRAHGCPPDAQLNEQLPVTRAEHEVWGTDESRGEPRSIRMPENLQLKGCTGILLTVS